MTFNASSVSLEAGLRSIREIAFQEKNYLATWNTTLASSVDAFFVLSMLANLDRAITLMDAAAGLPGMAGYAQQQMGDANYNIANEYAAMRSALDSVRAWIKSNLPANAIVIANGVQVAASYPPAVTAPLKALVVSAAATIA